ncbi:hypothetical protein Halru_3000 [Halovivax ruber XH-70]|uniref:Ba3-type terminal oxidase subunit CbaD n=1 Tax=Halovivax ruber (strain DSM 18193 / JCM 13892 / XH-70) TaxID=797302 RepID=L0IHV0_HALRX|nr:hypothetical protein [Halovivax ruber]AGB17567.1 hypothetical protein Halru_3000 [Halovivax ruber XH-70]
MSQSTDQHGAPPDSVIERELTHDEFDPIGTAVLITLYFLILVGMWLFTYFVEFLGNGPTVVGVIG